MHISAELVVLSACRTGQGKATLGDDVVGFTRALLAAGACAVLVSLWPVDDVATSLFMGKFYRELRDGKMPPSAIQTAQNYLRTLTREQILTELNALQVRLYQRAGGVDCENRPVVLFLLPGHRLTDPRCAALSTC
jgi:CHAT domain-containing protein